MASKFGSRMTGAFRIGMYISLTVFAYLLLTGDTRLVGIFCSMLHLGCFGVVFGTQFWTTFVGGIVLFKSVPLPTFAETQGAMFPSYFSLNSFMGSMLMACYAAHHPLKSWQFSDWLQVLCFACIVVPNCTNGFIIGPQSTQISTKLRMMESEAGLGQQTGGEAELPPILKEDANYMSLKKKFGALHGMSQLINLISILGSVVHLYFLAQSVQI